MGQLRACAFGQGTLAAAVWESVKDFRRAFGQPELQEALRDYPPSTVASPYLFQKLAVSNICVA